MTIFDPVAVANLAVFLVQLPRGRTNARKAPTPPPVEFISLEAARAVGEVVVSKTGRTECVRLENHSTRDLFIQAGEVLRGGDQDRAVAGDLIISAPRYEPESHLVPVFCADPRKEAFDLVEPTRLRGDKVQVPARRPAQPRLHGGGLVRGVVVEDGVDLQARRHRLFHLAQAGQELDAAMLGFRRAAHSAGGCFQGGKEREGAGAIVVVGASLGRARSG